MSTTTIIHFQHESVPAFQHQLSAGEVHAVTFHPSAEDFHVSLNNGLHMSVIYPSGQESALIAQVRAKGVPVQVAVSAHKSTAVHHKLRYIAGGILVVVILVVLAVLLLGRRRTLAEGEGGQGPSSSSPPQDPPAPAPDSVPQ